MVFPLAVWLNGVIQQEYGVARPPAWLALLLKWLRRRRERSHLMEEEAEGRADLNSLDLEM